MALYLAIDQGSHATRALAIDDKGQIEARAYVDIQTQHDGADRVEHDAAEVAQSVCHACEQLLDELGPRRVRLTAAGLATQRSSIVCWDERDATALSPVLSWRDRRAAVQIDSLGQHAELITRLTGLVLSPHYGASKMRWCLDNLPTVRAAHAQARLTIGPLSSFITRTLTGDAPSVVDPANASRTLLWDRRKRRFSSRLCKLFGVDRGVLPASVPSRYHFGRLRVADLDLPLRVVTGDQSAAFYAFGPSDPNVAYVNIGTGAFFQRSTGARPLLIAGLLNSVVWHEEDDVEYVIEGTVNGAASALHELAKHHGGDAHALVAEAIADARSPMPRPLYLNGIGGLAAPYWLPGFASEFIGGGGRSAQTLAVLESIAFLLVVNVRQAGRRLPPVARFVVSGGLSRIDFVCQCLADLSKLPIARSTEEEATSQGLVFLLAGKPAGWPAAHFDAEFRPRANDALRARFTRWQEELAARGARTPEC